MTQKPGMLSLAELLSPEPRPHPALQGILMSAMTPQPQVQYGLSGLLNPHFNANDSPWMYVTRRFGSFQSNLAITDRQRQDGITKFGGLVSTLNAAYSGHNSNSENAFMIGSWAKNTHIRPPRDVDMYYIMPVEVFHRFEAYAPGVNKQSALLQEVKGKLLASYPNSVIRGDGPVVLADFYGWTVEIVPAFLYSAEDRSYYVCDTKNGGRYIKTMPWHEVEAIDAAEKRANNNVRPLIRMLKCWQSYCNVPISSFLLELLAIEFIDSWAYREYSLFFYDWMCRDFFNWMLTKANGFVWAPGTYEMLWLGDAWKTQAESAYRRAAKAAEFEHGNKLLEAGDEWQKIFGADILRYV